MNAEIIHQLERAYRAPDLVANLDQRLAEVAQVQIDAKAMLADLAAILPLALSEAKRRQKSRTPKEPKK